MSETTTKQTGNFGEPWEAYTSAATGIPVVQLRDANGEHIDGPIFDDGDHDERLKRVDRAAACVNALDGIPDPAKFVEVFGQMREALARITSIQRDSEIDAIVIPLNSDRLIDAHQAIAAAKEVMP